MILLGAVATGAPPLAATPPGVPQDATALMALAAEATLHDDWPRARDLLIRAQRQAPGRADVAFELGVAFEHTQQPGDALAAYRQALVLRPDLVAASENLAALLAERGDVDGAVFVLTRAIERDPEEASLHYHHALLVLRREQGLDGGAVDALRRARALGYSKPHLYLLLGRVERLQGDAEEAVALLELGLQQAPDDVELLHESGLAYAAAGDLHTASVALDRAAAAAPDDESIAADLARTYLASKRPNDALEALRLHAQSDDLDVVYQLGSAQRDLGLPAARATMQRYQRLQAEVRTRREATTRAMVEVNSGIARWGEGDVVGAAARFEEALEHRPGWSTARAYLAAARFELGDVDTATAIAAALLDSDPDNAQALMVLGRARLAVSTDDGLAMLERAARLYPFRVVCLLTLADAYIQVGRGAEAVDLLDRADSIEPGNGWVGDLRQRLRAGKDPGPEVF